ncbi:MAG: succinate dehydrogenase, cytochrome b556 subunit [Burkholderiales bacterium]|nr:succinate dehydrogenase, cytochrome b556 subunit [Burkholderiales bacterium]
MKHRPKYLDLKRIRLPLPGIVSILHRASGLILFIFIPFLLFLLQSSLQSGQDFSLLVSRLASVPAKLSLVFLLWAFLHHFCAGVRILLLDMDIGVSLKTARASSKWVIAASLLATLLIGMSLW